MKTATLIAALVVALAAPALAKNCPPETHYPCGSSSCCPK